jgi:hypothetical protein
MYNKEREQREKELEQTEQTLEHDLEGKNYFFAEKFKISVANNIKK